MSETTVIDKQDMARHAGMYLTFRLGAETYGAPILRVREIVGVLEITRVPRTRPCLKGVVNLRGKVIPVVDLRVVFGMPAVEQTEETCIIVVEFDDEMIGALVDEVAEVLDIQAGDIEPPPQFGQDVETTSLLGMGKSDERIVALLDIDETLDIREFARTDTN